MMGQKRIDGTDKREKIREPKMKLLEDGASYHEVYCMVLSSESLTIRPVTVLHSCEVFTLHCSTSLHSEPS